MRRGLLLVCLLAWFAVAGIAAQRLVDRVLARVGDDAITHTDVIAATGFGVLDMEPDAAAPLQQLIDRRLVLLEILRRPPPPPDPAAVDVELARLRAQAGDRLSALMAETGVDEDRLRGMARDSLQISIYLMDRFPLVPASDADAERYYEANPEEFARNGVIPPFTEVDEAARRAAALQRREIRIAGWITTLRNRTDIRLMN